jgi:hypothetical protein
MLVLAHGCSLSMLLGPEPRVLTRGSGLAR